MSDLDESALRVPHWQAGEWIPLQSGQGWCFPPIRFKPCPLAESGAPRVFPALPDGAFAALTSLWLVEDDPARGLQYLAEAAAEMLRLNYRLTAEQALGLMTFQPVAGALEDVTQREIDSVEDLYSYFKPTLDLIELVICNLPKE